MNIRELIDMLKMEDPELDVVFQVPSRDYLRTMLTPAVEAVEGATFVKYNEHHKCEAMASDDEDDDARAVVMLV